MKRAGSIVVLFVIIVAGYVTAAPFIAIYQIKSGVEDRDSGKLSEQIDFTTLRANLKEQLNVLVVREAASGLKDDNRFTALAMGFVSKLGEGMVDTYVTPSGLANLMEGKKPLQGEGSEQSPGSRTPRLEPFKNARYAYDSTSKFSLWVKDGNGGEIRFVLTRDGLAWKLSNIVLPIKG
jgi:hypothetical protein